MISWATLDEDPRSAAERVLAKSGIGGSPVDLNRIVALWPGLRIHLDDLDAPGCSIRLNDVDGEILVRASDPFIRRRFTVAHELGHWILADNAPPSGERIEIWCDRFAGEVLVPRGILAPLLKSATEEEFAPYLASLPYRFLVSRVTMWSQLALEPGFTVASRSEGRLQTFFSAGTSAAQRSATVRALTAKPGFTKTATHLIGTTSLRGSVIAFGRAAL